MQYFQYGRPFGTEGGGGVNYSYQTTQTGMKITLLNERDGSSLDV